MIIKRGDIVLCADKAGDFTGKPRPFLVVQKTVYIEAKDSLMVCPISTVLDQSNMRLRLQPNPQNGLADECDVHTDKVTAIRKSRVGKKVGEITSMEMIRASVLIRDWLDL